MKQFKVMEIPKNTVATETLLNQLGERGWVLVSCTMEWMFLQRDVIDVPDDEEGYENWPENTEG